METLDPELPRPTAPLSDGSRRDRRTLGSLEFTALLSMIMALGALGIDIMLPVLSDIRADLGLPRDSTQVAGLVTAYLIGMALGQVFYGPVSDRFGRKRTLYVGFSIYGLGAVLSAVAPTLELMLASRLLWGIGGAGPRVVALAIVRDTYEGERMARAMSFIMAIFILVPVFAPSLGSLIALGAQWRWVFGFCAMFVVVLASWALKLPETLSPDNRLELRLGRVVLAARFVLGNRQTLGYTLGLTMLFGGFTAYLAGSELIFSEVFGLDDEFPLIFGGLAVAMGVAMLTNGFIVGRIGVRRLVHGVMLAYMVGAACFVGLALSTDGTPPFWPFVLVLVVRR